ncbi:response regulator transcription factor [Pseudobacillus wudalianchiensis]|uniref:AraC family transcriptional regulator n=1 Tax=Pseudobacillus wudalianchiensis TaxID=1743143 RepID=A0A1B9AAF6_9BACI|nr:helix-turn-helix domain-containing protein [Bacillus wudalianchiensis]OCA80826.1 AraC family transcriptional regulator [Bacillus wudalianchiensis]
MDIHLVAKDKLEAQGIRWVIESHLTGVNLITWNTIEEFEQMMESQRVAFVILNMDGWSDEKTKLGEALKQKNVRWLGISSERIFQTAYRALRYRAEDVLFRPFSPLELIKHIQQLRYQLRNEPSYLNDDAKNEYADMVDYPDLFLTERQSGGPITMAAFLIPQPLMLPLVYEQLLQHAFSGRYRIFALSDFILCVQETKDAEVCKEEYQAFLATWKERMDEPLAIVIQTASSEESFKSIYQKTRELTRQVFFQGYDIILAENGSAHSQEMDPFLTPLEQRQWIEMLEKRETKAIRHWMESAFLTFQPPYPDPEIVRIRLTSILAQVRRHMKSHELQSTQLEAAYHEVFQKIIHQPVMYQIIEELLSFVEKLLYEDRGQLEGGARSLVEKTRELIEANYWDCNWNLAACAEALRINKSTLSRRFAAESGQTFRDTLHQVRLREAKRLLKETDLPLEEVARLAGYSHQSYFNAKFKLYESVTPSAYRSGY